MGSRDTKMNTTSKTGSRTEKHGEHSNVLFACQKDSSSLVSWTVADNLWVGEF
jgi:hypothetical protein